MGNPLACRALATIMIYTHVLDRIRRDSTGRIRSNRHLAVRGGVIIDGGLKGGLRVASDAQAATSLAFYCSHLGHENRYDRPVPAGR